MSRKSYALLRLCLLCALGVMTLGASAASAAVTSSNVTAPVSQSYFQRNKDNPADPAHQITVSGTTANDGTAGNVDLKCFYPSGSKTIATNVTVNPDGTFTYSGAPPTAEEPCVVRAVPTGTTPADLGPFAGPTIEPGDFSTSTVSSGPNSGALWDFYNNAVQLSGDADYQSVGNGGVYDANPVDPATLVEGGDLFYASDYLATYNADRSDILVGGDPAYASATAEKLFTGTSPSSAFAGLPPLTVTSSQDPATGNLTIHESELLVKCDPTPATYPATTTSCTSFVSTGVRFDRTIVQDHAGRQAHVSDSYTSVDGQPHSLDLRYGQDFNRTNAGLRFPWVDGATYNTHVAGDTEGVPPSAPATIYANTNNTKADGDQTSAQGAITFAQRPDALSFLANGNSGSTHLYVGFVRNVPAGGSVSLQTTYSWAFTIADAQALAAAAEQSYTPPTASTGSASAVTISAATVSGTINPNGQASTYHFEYGTSGAYGTSTPTGDAGSATTAGGVSANLSGLAPGTTYHYRLVAVNGAGTTTGADATFTTASPPPPPPPPPPITAIKLGRTRVHGFSASVPLSCSGAAATRCAGTILETIRVRVRHGHHLRSVTRTVATVAYSVAAGQTKTISLSLNRTGRAALKHAHGHRLTVRITVRLKGTVVASRSATFKLAIHRKPHPRH